MCVIVVFDVLYALQRTSKRVKRIPAQARAKAVAMATRIVYKHVTCRRKLNLRPFMVIISRSPEH